jgi:predicted choloylglycine hydrolase
MFTTTFRARAISTIDPDWESVFREYWPAYDSWYRRGKGSDINPQALRQAQRELATVMPELLPLYESFLEIANDSPVAAQFLTGYQPPAYLSGCSQAILLDDEPTLIRNYDLSPNISENLVTRSDWQGQQVICSNECLWGLNDGLNRSGLAVSLTYGGSNRVGKGFGIPLILRYVLQTCEDVRQAVAVLRRVPSHMAYNISLVDKRGSFATVMVAPEKPAIVTRERCITNHQDGEPRPLLAAFTRTEERKRFLDRLLGNGNLGEQPALEAFLKTPLHNTNYRQNFGTVYTAVYKPSTESMSYHWPLEQSWRHGFADFRSSEKTVDLGRYASLAPVHGDIVGNGASDHSLSATIRQQLLQSLLYMPVSAVGQPQALEKLKRNLRTDNAFCWHDYARQIAQVWHYPASAN